MLTKRLAVCAALVTKGGVVCDVGTDHAYLPAYLLKNNICTRAVVTDIHAGPLEAARRTLTESGVLDRAQLVLGDGVAGVSPDGITDLVIAGMGGEMIVHILEQCPWRQEVHLVLQPMTKIPTLRRWLAENGFGTWTERIAAEGDRMYTVIETCYDGGMRTLSLFDAEVGCPDWNTPDARRYAMWKQGVCEMLAHKLSAAGCEEAAKWENLAKQLAKLRQTWEESIC